jgi:hypothetical protein
MGRWRASAVVAFVLTVVAAIDAALEEAWDLVAVLAVVAVLVAGLTIRLSFGRQTVTVRPDLYRALERRAAVEGESIDALVDRVVAFDVRLQERVPWTKARD